MKMDEQIAMAAFTVIKMHAFYHLPVIFSSNFRRWKNPSQLLFQFQQMLKMIFLLQQNNFFLAILIKIDNKKIQK